MKYSEDRICHHCEEEIRLEFDVDVTLDEFNQPYVIGHVSCLNCTTVFEVSASFNVEFE